MNTSIKKIYDDRTEYTLNGKYHREDGPAIEWADGYKEWYLNDKLHREDGPAVEYNDGTKRWYLNGKEYTEEEFNQQMNQDNIIIDGKKFSKDTIKEALKAYIN